MNKIYLNELSLVGQFENIDEFLDASIPLMRCMRYITKNHWQIDKHSVFYKQKITMDKTWNDLRGLHSDKARRLKSLLLSTTDNPPYWDLQTELKQDLSAMYQFNDQDVSATSLAEAAETEGILLSYLHNDFYNTQILVIKNKSDKFILNSAATLQYLAELLWLNEEISLLAYLTVKYEGTRLSFSEFEKQYGFQDFEKEEIRDCLQTFDKFIHMENWDEIFRDQGLRYKKYSPSSKEVNWFQGTKYEGKVIDKFRCSNPKRCFGYREKEVFYVLRMERTHKISDNG